MRHSFAYTHSIPLDWIKTGFAETSKINFQAYYYVRGSQPFHVINKNTEG